MKNIESKKEPKKIQWNVRHTSTKVTNDLKYHFDGDFKNNFIFQQKIPFLYHDKIFLSRPRDRDSDFASKGNETENILVAIPVCAL